MTPLRARISRLGRAVARDVVAPPWVPGGHFYSPLTSIMDRERAVRTRRPPGDAVDLREEEQVRLARQLDLRRPATGRWVPENGMFDAADAALLRGMLLHHRPKRIVEIGSGYSTALVLDVAEREFTGVRITCIEPHADRLRSRLRPGDDQHLELLEHPLQAVDVDELAGGLQTGDFLFIDSTHVVKAGSDVLWLLLRVLPALPPGVIIHIHDVHWPFEYPDDWIREGRDWNEAYFVHAFLAYNSRFHILLFADWLAAEHPELIAPENRGVSGGSLWLEKVADSPGR